MEEFIVMLIVGVVLIVMGIIHMTGNISTLHAYHRKRVKEEDRLPFGRIIGGGTVIAGASVAAFGGFSMAAFFSQQSVYTVVGGVALGVGLVAGLGMVVFALMKYNKGIF